MTNLVGQSDNTAFTDPASVSGAPNACIYNSFVASSSGTATSLFVWIRPNGFGTNVKLFITDASKNVLASTAAISPTVDAWYSSSISNTTITAGTTYYLGMYFDANDGTSGHWGGNPGAFGVNYDTTSGTFSSIPATVAGAFNGGIESFAMYADGSVVTAGPVPYKRPPFYIFS